MKSLTVDRPLVACWSGKSGNKSVSETSICGKQHLGTVNMEAEHLKMKKPKGIIQK